MKKSPFTKKELEDFKALLLEKRTRLMKEIQNQVEEVSSEKSDEPGDMVDMATELLEQEMNLSLTTAEVNTLKDIEEALARLEEGKYGICIDTEELINKSRLKVLPEAKRSLGAQEKYDKIQKDKLKRSTNI
ncbi:MAG: TraR/DksA C4-type zinc finger protein [Leptospirales bacterium]